MSTDSSISNTQITQVYDEFNNWIVNPVGILVIIVIIIALLAIIKVTKKDSGNIMENIGTAKIEKNNAFVIPLVIIVGLIVAYLAINFFQYFLNLDIWTSLTNIFQPEADLNINISLLSSYHYLKINLQECRE